jgi:pimeloyl-ACP methyl ester carboxylesterase
MDRKTISQFDRAFDHAHTMRLPRIPPLWGEARLPSELRALTRDPLFRDPPATTPRTVLTIPGLLADDPSLATMRGWLRRQGHWAAATRLPRNIDCSEATVQRLSDRLQRLAEQRGERVVIVGQSRGGLLGRVLAVRHPDLVAGVVALGSPLRAQFAVHPVVHATIFGLGLFGTLGAPSLFRASCAWGECCTDYMTDLVAPFPEDVGFISVYSRTDGIIDWRAALDPYAQHVEIEASHCGMAVNRHAYRVIAEALAPVPAPARRAPERVRRAA